MHWRPSLLSSLAPHQETTSLYLLTWLIPSHSFWSWLLSVPQEIFSLHLTLSSCVPYSNTPRGHLSYSPWVNPHNRPCHHEPATLGGAVFLGSGAELWFHRHCRWWGLRVLSRPPLGSEAPAATVHDPVICGDGKPSKPHVLSSTAGSPPSQAGLECLA